MISVRTAAALSAAALSACATSAEYHGGSIPPPFVSQPAVSVPASASVPESVPPPVDPPGFRRPTQAALEQQRTAELLAAQQRSTRPPVQLPTPGDTVITQPAVFASSPMAAQASPSFTTTFHDSGLTPGMVGGAGIPPMPQAAPGECFALVRKPEQYRDVQKTYVARPATERIEVIPARYQSVMHTYVAHEAYERLEVIPPTFRTVTEQVEVRPAQVRYVTTEPEYETVTERVMVTPPRQVWKPGRGPIERIDHATGQILCLVEEPATYKTITRRVLRRPAEVREVVVPAEYRTVTRRVLDRPAEIRRVMVPAQTATIPVQQLVEPARVNRIPVPEELGTTTVRELVAPAQLEWRPVLCETNMTPDLIRRVQDALRREGFDPGPSDGRIGPNTIRALNAYQRSRNLPEDSYLNVETARSLGVI